MRAARNTARLKRLARGQHVPRIYANDNFGCWTSEFSQLVEQCVLKGGASGEIARILQGAPGYGFPAGVDPGLEANVNYRTDSLAYANGCHACEVEVDNNPRVLNNESGEGTGRAIVVGLPDAAVKESLERVRSALFNSGYFFPQGKTLVNLAPKWSSARRHTRTDITPEHARKSPQCD